MQPMWTADEDHNVAINSALSLRQVFAAYGDELECVEVFKYLDRFMEYNNNDAHAIRMQLCKVHKV